MKKLCKRIITSALYDYTAFPAWPKEWDVEFRLPLKHGAFIHGKQVDGQRTVWEERV